ncbi:MAG: 3'-5' exoribonuclease [Bacteroidales bacterium]|jgi:hypothetical protein|nr:3'-5' exoribonuclease [Bacteroidales bacterium]
MEYTDVMLDLETLSNKSNSALLSIGAVEFNIETGETGREFYKVIDLKSCLDVGLIINSSTFYWWLRQNQEARDAISVKEKYHLSMVLGYFRTWLNDCIQGVNIWGNGVRFDVGILEDAYVACGYEKMPWNFRSERDVRTLVAFAPEIKANLPFTGTLHHPIDDCKHQIKYCTKIWKKLNIK